jgi:hypothetical protein
MTAATVATAARKRRALARIEPPDLPMRTDALLDLLRANRSLRTALVDAGLEVWRERNRGRVRFTWRGRTFRFEATSFRFLVKDGSGRPLVERWQ